MHLQQWKLWGILAKADGEADTAIYNSRNYWGMLATLKYHIYYIKSTIVEIIEAY